ncbi:MAG TPA: gliding motility-associated C-terminal domain-containing protein, partial [Bacteroidia bacterium]|nr:gliding motility-associated C-terminal domain-containing protein [Bacteroidia bacterium]
PTVTTGPPQTMCYGDTISIGGPAIAGDTYKWTPSSGLSSYTISNPKASPADTTMYYLAVTDTVTGCTSTDSVLITVKPVPSAYITAGDTANFCKGSPMTLTATNGASYLWSNGATTKTITIDSVGVYSVGVTYSDGCIDYSGPTTVIIDSLPSVNTGSNKTICKGDSTIIGTAAVSGITYMWSPATGLNYDTIAQPEASPTVTTTYVLTVTDTTKGCINKDSVTVTVVPQPIANAGPNKIICKGDTTTIGTAATSGVSYKWSPSTGLSSDTIAQPDASPANTTTYILTASNGACSNTDTVIVSVSSLPTANAGPDKTICKGDSTTIGTAAVSGVTYRWSPSTGLNNDTIAQPEASPASTTIYILTVTDTTKGCTNKDTVTVNVSPRPIANTGPNKTICKGDGTTIGASPISGVTYKWSPATALNSDTISNPYANPTATTTYTLIASNGICSDTNSVVVTVSPLPTINAGPNKSICNGDSTVIGTAAISGVSYKWLPPTGLSNDTIAQPEAHPGITTTYTLTITNAITGCKNSDSVTVRVFPNPVANAGPNKTICNGDSVTLGSAAVSGVTYKWSPSTGLSSSTVAQPNASPATTTTYTLTVSNGTCSNTDSVTITVTPSPTANAGPNKTICKGDTTSIGTAAVAGLSYSWSPSAGLSSSTVAQPNASPATTTTYTLTVSNGNCSNSNTVVVNVLPQPMANVGPSKSICLGDSTNIGGPMVSGLTYTWSSASGLSSYTISDPYAHPIVTTTYTLIVSNGLCTSIDSVTISVFTAPVVNAGSHKTICKGDSATIGSASVSGLTYSWSPSSGLNSSTISQPNASPAITTLYTLTVINGGCSKSDTVSVTVNPVPAANVGNGQTLCDASSVTLGGPAVTGDTYMWTPATGLNSATISDPTANPGTTITYTLTETDTSTGCSMSNQVTITTVPTDLYTGISPNGDGVNDWWDIPMLNCYPTNSVIIVNRWGSEVWSANNYDNDNIKWAGKDNNGVDLPDGTYYYIIKYNNIEKEGWVFIKR